MSVTPQVTRHILINSAVRRRGQGLHACEEIPAGAFVVEYTGEVITEKERLARMAAARARGAVHFYIMELQKGLYIDAEHMGSKARFMNSSCDANCETQKWKDAATGASSLCSLPFPLRFGGGRTRRRERGGHVQARRGSGCLRSGAWRRGTS